eukprot:COSAG01_NODE_200_length_22187_cov_59.140529_8_plen_157_part_00
MYEYDSATVLVTFSPPKLYQARGVDTEVQAEDLFIYIRETPPSPLFPATSSSTSSLPRPPLIGGYPHSHPLEHAADRQVQRRVRWVASPLGNRPLTQAKLAPAAQLERIRPQLPVLDSLAGHGLQLLPRRPHEVLALAYATTTLRAGCGSEYRLPP